MTDHPSCETCRFLREFRSSSGRFIGDCMRYPPTIGYEKSNGHPIVRIGDWCGEYQPIPIVLKETQDE